MKSEAVAMRKIVILGIVSLVFLAGCASGTSQPLNNQSSLPSGSNPTPTITTISPGSTAAGGTAFTLTVNGTNFVAASVVNFGGSADTTTFVSTTQLTAAIPAAAIASASTAAVTVTNAAPGGGTSNPVNFSITSGSNPVPTISSLDQTCAPVGAQAFTLGVLGSNLVASSVVRWNGSDLPTTVVNNFNGPMVTAQVPASDISATGPVAITVFNPAPGGGSSNSLTFTIATGGAFPQSIAVDPSGKFAYVANGGCPDAFAGNVSTYSINPTTGALTSIGSPALADFGPHAVSVDPSGKFAYVANDGAFEVTGGSVSMYTINATTGALTSAGTIDAPCAPPPSPGSCAPYSVAVDPSGKFAYVANEGGFAPTSVSMYTINGTNGALTFIGMIAVGGGGRAISVTVHPTGKFAYVATECAPAGSAGVVSRYSINASGALTSIGTTVAGLSPTSIAIDASGKFAYVTNSGSDDVSMYSIDATTGALTSMGTIAAGTVPGSVAVDPMGKFAYVANYGSNNISMYAINAATGTLTSTGTIAAGTSPASVAVDPTGKFAYVANSGSNNVSIYAVDATTGVLTLVGTMGT